MFTVLLGVLVALTAWTVARELSELRAEERRQHTPERYTLPCGCDAVCIHVPHGAVPGGVISEVIVEHTCDL